ncbi:MAG: NAD(P)H-dependent oxidoreductase [Desulfosarcinaceae bacterium]|nr:NAD(P)H-dependent oxidoreductase [Desulfosarcinaceae bacterium]
MKNVFIINAHEPWPFSEGKLNRTMAERAAENLKHKGYEIQMTTMQDAYTVANEIEKHRWADVLILQTPCNWMGVPWTFKKYMDEVYTAGMDGRLCNGDGRSREDLSKQYGSGGTLTGKQYLLSITYNAPLEAFDDPDQAFFGGRGVDDLFWPMHLNFKFFGMTPMGTFACHDVLKNPDVENDFLRFDAHLDRLFPSVG